MSDIMDGYMLGLLLVLMLGAWVIYQPQSISEVRADLPVKISDKLGQLWTIAQESLQTNKYLRAEKALLTILRIDERNASAYNRLGILYAKQRSLDDAIECFEKRRFAAARRTDNGGDLSLIDVH